MDKIIYLEKRNIRQYPKENPLFHPAILYPEYPFKNEFVSIEKNEVYDMVRACLLGLEMDKENYGGSRWNPLGEIINKGDTILVKPNMVKDCDLRDQYECTLTHPSVVRAILDYCVIAAPQKIILGDAPIQGANMKKILEDYGYLKLLDFYRKQGVNIEFCDFRERIVVQKHGVIKEIKNSERHDHVVINLNEMSKHNSKEKKDYRINSYTDKKINQYHSFQKHEYIISPKVLEADVIINLPKPKTHRFAGITGAQKNFVGICSDKECLPHFTKGTKYTGGDETNKKSLLQQEISKYYFMSLKESEKEHYIKAYFYNILYAILMKFKNEAIFTNGAWYGNDTIWRTIIDLNKIILYASKTGELNWDKQSRRIFTVGDMIISGEKDGPLNPKSKQLGCILASRNCAVFDYVFCRMTGFDENLISSIKNSIREEDLCPYFMDEVLLYSNIASYDNKALNTLSFTKEYNFEPHPFWKEVLHTE